MAGHDEATRLAAARRDDETTQPRPGSAPDSNPSGKASRSGITAGAPARPTRPLRRGTEVGRYVVLDHLGSGGLGDVFSAWDPELDRKVALKLLKATAYGRVDLARLHGRLLREAQAMARLSHPNVVAVHDVGLSDERIFIAMEFVSGLTFRAWAAHTPRTWQQIRDALLQAGEGLVAAHEAGLVHRDFKPSNVIVSEDGRVRVLDFGLARRPSDESNDPQASVSSMSARALIDEAMTQTGTFIGTPAYMAPEQYAHDMVDSRADQFSFCVTAFEAFFGERPFSGKGRARLDAIARGKLIFPKAGARVPSWLRKVLARGLRADPAQRHPSMRALLHALQADRRSKRRMIAALAFSAIASGVGGAAAYAVLQPPPPERDDRVDTLVHAAHEAAARSHFVYPAADEPDGATAYRVVLDLEALEGDVADLADEAAAGLRTEFASTLVALGDRYFDLEGGAPFATDYYAQALLFVPDQAHALERLVMTPGELAGLRDRAEQNAFSTAELEAAQLLAALAKDDPTEQEQAVASVYKKKKRRPGLSTSAHVETILGERSPEVFGQGEPDTEDAPSRPTAPAATPTATPEPAPAAGATKTKAVAGAEPSAEPSHHRRDPGAAAQLVAQAKAAMRAGSLGRAETLLNQALERDRGSHAACITLSELYFQRSSYHQSAKYALDAVRLAPNRASYRIQLGDAYFKVMRYAEAREQYEKAAQLGDGRASARLDRLRSKLGE